MGIKQAIYTSCKTGIEGKSGVCLYSMSESLNVASKKRFEADSLYRKDYKCRLPIEELPLSFFTGVDETGAFYIQQVRSVLDYSSGGRTGNVLSQMMLYENPREMKRPAMAYYEGPDFRSAMREEELQSMNRPEYLPELEELTPGSRTGFEEICRFLKPEAGDGEGNREETEQLRRRRQEALQHLTAAVIRAHREKRTVVVMDTAENIVMWMAAVTYCLPMELNCQLTLATYAFDPEAAGLDLCGYVEGVSDSNFLGSRHDYSIVFDMGKFDYPPQDISSGFFNNIKMAMLLGSDVYIEQFNAFVDSRRFSAFGDELYLAYEVYAFLDSGEMVDETKYSLSQVCDFAKQWLVGGEINTFTEQLLQQFSSRKRAQPEEIKLLVSVMMQNPLPEMTAWLLEMDARQNEDILSPKLLDVVWNGYIAAQYAGNPGNMAALETLLQQSPERSTQLMNFQVRRTGADGMAKFRENLLRTLDPLTGRWTADSEKVLEKYEDFIQDTWQDEERFGRELELICFLMELKKNSSQIQRVAENVAARFPMTDPEISEKNKLFRKGKGREYVTVIGKSEIDLYGLADTLLDYAADTRSDIDFARVSLYLAGVDLWMVYFSVDRFDFARTRNRLTEEFVDSPIDTGNISVREMKDYFRWIRIPLDETVFTRDSFDILFGAYHMMELQRYMLAGLLMDWMTGDFDKKYSGKEIGGFLYFCYETDREGYRQVLTEKLEGMKKADLQAVSEYFAQDPDGYDRNFRPYLDSICGNKQKKGTIIHKLFGRDS